MIGRLHRPALIVAAALLAACQDNPPRPDASVAPPPKADPVPATTSPPAPAADQPGGSPAEPPAETTAEPANPPTLVAKPKPTGKPRVSPKSAAYDKRGSAYPLLQAPRSALANFPADTLGGIDWVEALNQGLIAPRANVSGTGAMRRRDDAIIMRNTLDMPWVRFPHAEHTEWLDCSNCHPHPFEAKTGSNEITMDSIMRGRHCGMCHDRVAFSIFACERCHSVTHPGSPAAWW